MGAERAEFLSISTTSTSGFRAAGRWGKMALSGRRDDADVRPFLSNPAVANSPCGWQLCGRCGRHAMVLVSKANFPPRTILSTLALHFFTCNTATGAAPLCIDAGRRVGGLGRGG